MTDRLTAETAPSLRAILSERAPELLAALRGVVVRDDKTGALRVLVRAVKDAGLLAEPSQPAPLPAMWCGADAFTQEDSDAG